MLSIFSFLLRLNLLVRYSSALSSFRLLLKPSPRRCLPLKTHISTLLPLAISLNTILSKTFIALGRYLSASSSASLLASYHVHSSPSLRSARTSWGIMSNVSNTTSYFTGAPVLTLGVNSATMSACASSSSYLSSTLTMKYTTTTLTFMVTPGRVHLSPL